MDIFHQHRYEYKRTQKRIDDCCQDGTTFQSQLTDFFLQLTGSPVKIHEKKSTIILGITECEIYGCLFLFSNVEK